MVAKKQYKCNPIKTQFEVSKFPKFIHFKLHIDEKLS